MQRRYTFWEGETRGNKHVSAWCRRLRQPLPGMLRLRQTSPALVTRHANCVSTESSMAPFLDTLVIKWTCQLLKHLQSKFTSGTAIPFTNAFRSKRVVTRAARGHSRWNEYKTKYILYTYTSFYELYKIYLYFFVHVFFVWSSSKASCQPTLFYSFLFNVLANLQLDKTMYASIYLCCVNCPFHLNSCIVTEFRTKTWTGRDNIITPPVSDDNFIFICAFIYSSAYKIAMLSHDFSDVLDSTINRASTRKKSPIKVVLLCEFRKKYQVVFWAIPTSNIKGISGNVNNIKSSTTAMKAAGLHHHKSSRQLQTEWDDNKTAHYPEVIAVSTNDL